MEKENNLNRPRTSQATVPGIETSPSEDRSRTGQLRRIISQICGEERTPTPFKLSQRAEEERTLPNPIYEDGITPIPKPNKGTTSKESSRPKYPR